jgi:hypothetical protein
MNSLYKLFCVSMLLSFANFVAAADTSISSKNSASSVPMMTIAVKPVNEKNSTFIEVPQSGCMDTVKNIYERETGKKVKWFTHQGKQFAFADQYTTKDFSQNTTVLFAIVEQ